MDSISCTAFIAMEAETAGQSDPVLKLLRKPDVFRGGADDSAAWEQWSFTFRVWLGAADAPYLNELSQIERDLERSPWRSIRRYRRTAETSLS